MWPLPSVSRGSNADLRVLHLRWDASPLRTLEQADGLFVGGGNTYALLKIDPAMAPGSETRPRPKVWRIVMGP